MNQYAWLALTGGRTIVHGGLPHHETWTSWGTGKDFVDQQWLGQGVLYVVHALGGFGLLAGFHALTTSAAIVVALVVARRPASGCSSRTRGGPPTACSGASRCSPSGATCTARPRWRPASCSSAGSTGPSAAAAAPASRLLCSGQGIAVVERLA